TKQLLSAVEVQFTRLSTGKIHHTATTGNDGAFLTVLPSQEDYALRVHKQGYIFHSEHFALAKGVPNKAFELDIYLNPIEETITKDSPKKAVILKNVFFDTASAKLLAPSQGELNQLANLLKENPALRIQINGHTDNVGQAQANQQLSRARAKAVYDYLMQQGIAASRLQYEGFGADQPLASNTTPDGRQKNRRTEFVVLSR
ncbi:MAG: OmpA family protein, partial [Bacteroidota bacterium]